MSYKNLQIYLIKFDVQFIPFDFDKWRKLNTEKYKKNRLLLNKYKSLIIKSIDLDILLQMDELNYHFYCYNCKIIDKTNKGISISETKLLSIVEKTIFNYWGTWKWKDNRCRTYSKKTRKYNSL